MIKLYYCECCKKGKDWSEMHSHTLCKNCWIQEYEKEISARIKKTWITRKLNIKTKRILEL